MNNSAQLRIKLAMEPQTIATLCHVISGPGVCGDLEPVLIHLFSDYFRYMLLVWGDSAMENTSKMSWRDESPNVPEEYLEAAILDSDMIITTSLAHVATLGWDNAATLAPVRLAMNMRMFMASVKEASDRLLDMELPEEMLQHIAALSGYAQRLSAALEVLSPQAFEDVLEEMSTCQSK